MKGSYWISGAIKPPNPSASARRAASGIARQSSSGIGMSTSMDRSPFVEPTAVSGPPCFAQAQTGARSRRAMRAATERSPRRRDLGIAAAHGAEREANAAHGLAGAMLVLDQGEAHVFVAELSEADPRRHRNLRLAQQQLGELDRAQSAKLLGDARPHEHRRLRPLDWPAGARQPVAQDVAPALI